MFELRSDAKRRLAREVKIAVRLGKKRNGELYRAVHNNSFSPFPLLPIGETSQEVKHLSAVYTVQVLYINRDMNFLTFRLPKFLLLLFLVDRSFAIALSVSLSVCLSVCLCVGRGSRLCADRPCPWLGPPLAALRYVMYFRFYG